MLIELLRFHEWNLSPEAELDDKRVYAENVIGFMTRELDGWEGRFIDDCLTLR